MRLGDAAASSISSLCKRCGCARRPAIDYRKEAALRLARVARAIKEVLRFTEGDVPGRYDQAGGKMSIGITGRSVAGIGQHNANARVKSSRISRARAFSAALAIAVLMNQLVSSDSITNS